MTEHGPQPRLWMRMSRFALDANGRPVKCLSFNRLQRELTPASRARFDIAAVRRWERKPTLGLASLLAATVSLGFGVFMSLAGDVPAWFLTLWFVVSAAAGLLGLTRLGLFRCRTRIVLGEAVAAGICPSCGYDLLAREEPVLKQRTKCPECANEWVIGRDPRQSA